MTTTDLPPRGSGTTEGEPTPAPHSVGVDSEGGRGEGLTRTGARVRARLTVPDMPELLTTLFVGDTPHPFTKTMPRLKKRIAYAQNGDLHANTPLYTALTVLIACPIAVAIDIVEWLTFPLGRLFLTAIILIILFVCL